MVNRQLALEEKDPILITGAARSGTSMVAGVISICGAFGGKMSGPTPYNRKGMFENAFIRDQIEKPYLKQIGADPLGQLPLPDTLNMWIPRNWKNMVHEVMLKEGYKSGPWFYKGAKACLIWPVWQYAFPDAKWIIVRRTSKDIADSCLKTSFMHKRTTFEEWIDWIHTHEERWIEMIKAEMNVREVWPERMVKGNYQPMKETIEWLGLEWKGEEVAAFIEPKLWKARQKQK